MIKIEKKAYEKLISDFILTNDIRKLVERFSVNRVFYYSVLKDIAEGKNSPNYELFKNIAQRKKVGESFIIDQAKSILGYLVPRDVDDLEDYYGILGVDRNATDEEIRKKWISLMKSHHPDMAGDAEAEQAKKINEAYEVLGDTIKRNRYDEVRIPSMPVLVREKSRTMRYYAVPFGIVFIAVLVYLSGSGVLFKSEEEKREVVDNINSPALREVFPENNPGGENLKVVSDDADSERGAGYVPDEPGESPAGRDETNLHAQAVTDKTDTDGTGTLTADRTDTRAGPVGEEALGGQHDMSDDASELGRYLDETKEAANGKAPLAEKTGEDNRFTEVSGEAPQESEALKDDEEREEELDAALDEPSESEPDGDGLSREEDAIEIAEADVDSETPESVAAPESVVSSGAEDVSDDIEVLENAPSPEDGQADAGELASDEGPQAPVVKDNAAQVEDVPETVGDGRVTKAPPDDTLAEPETPPESETKPPAESGSNVYTVKKGDSPWSIASKHGITVNALLKYNGKSDNNLDIGDTLLIPSESEVKAIEEADRIYAARMESESLTKNTEHKEPPLEAADEKEAPKTVTADRAVVKEPAVQATPAKDEKPSYKESVVPVSVNAEGAQGPDTASLYRFASAYVASYRNKNLPQIKSYFASGATENGVPITSVFPRYEENFRKTVFKEYEIKITSADIRNGKGFVSGTFNITFLDHETRGVKQSTGDISWKLLWADGAWKVEELNYKIERVVSIN